MPMPITTALGPSISPCASMSTPPNFPCPVRMSFGHFSCTSLAPNLCNARSCATPTAKPNPDKAFKPQSKRHNKENVNALPRPLCQVRPIRPRPAVCISTARTLPPAETSSPARCNNKALLEVACARISMSNLAASLPSQRRISSRSNRCHGCARR